MRFSIRSRRACAATTRGAESAYRSEAEQVSGNRDRQQNLAGVAEDVDLVHRIKRTGQLDVLDAELDAGYVSECGVSGRVENQSVVIVQW